MDEWKKVPKGEKVKTTAGSFYENWLESGKTKYEPTQEDIKCELQLQALSTFEPLKFKFNLNKIKKELEKYEDDWIPYLPREGVTNDRQGLCLMGIPGDSHKDGLSMPEARTRHQKWLIETDFSEKTQLYHDLETLHPMLDFYQPLGRTHIVRVNAGGWFPPHKDYPHLTRKTFRIVAFLSQTTDFDNFEWHTDGKVWPVQPGRAYYVDTRKVHRTHAWGNNSLHLIVNVPKTWENVIKLMSVTKH